MTITLSQESEALINELVAAGEYANADEIIAHALRSLRQDKSQLTERENFLREIHCGWDQIGKGTDFTDEDYQHLLRRIDLSPDALPVS